MLNKKLILSTLAVALLATSGVTFANESSLDNEDIMILARRGADDPPGTERPGDNHRQRRGGRVMEDAGEMILARRGADDPPGTERPGDNHRQRRGGRA